MIGINKLLWIAVNNGEPRALDLNHQSVSRQECMCHIIQCVINRSYFFRLERQGIVESFTEASSEQFATNHQLVPTHWIVTL